MNILFVCHGNICRSAMAECIFSSMVQSLPIEVDSAATTSDALGEDIYPPAKRVLSRHGVKCLKHSAKRITPDMYNRFDYIIGMDEENMRDLRRFFPDPEGKVRPLFENEAVEDPWYTGDFDGVYHQIVRGCRQLLKELGYDAC